jgi:hypothetical protein
MATFREYDPLVELLVREQERVLACLIDDTGDRAAALAEARGILERLADAEVAVLFPAFSRIHLRLEQEHLLADMQTARADQLATLEALARKRQPRLRKLAAIQLSEVIAHHNERLSTELVASLGSQLPRPLYRSIAHAFIARYSGTPTMRIETTETRPRRNVA